MNKTKRQGFTWDQEHKSAIDDIKADLRGYGEGAGEPSNTELFLLCLAFGFNSGQRRPVPPRKTDGPRLEHIGESQLALIKAVALADADSTDLLLEEDAIYDVVEGYAAEGLMLLANARTNEPNFKAWIKKKLVEFAKEPTGKI